MKKIIIVAVLLLMSGCASTYQPGSAGYNASLQQSQRAIEKAPVKNYSLSEVRAPLACAFEFVMVQDMWDKFQNAENEITREDMIEFTRRDDAARRCMDKHTKAA
jgi:uncharacterized lipoprotein YmbA